MLSMIESQIFTSLFFLSLRYVANTIFGYLATIQSLINQPSESVPVPDKTVLPSFVRSISGECIFILFLSMKFLANILTYSSRKTEESNMLKNDTVLLQHRFRRDCISEDCRHLLPLSNFLGARNSDNLRASESCISSPCSSIILSADKRVFGLRRCDLTALRMKKYAFRTIPNSI